MVPVTGIIPRFIPTWTKKCVKKYIAIPETNRDSKFVLPLVAVSTSLYIIIIKITNNIEIPMKPHSSPKAEKTKSVSDSGKKESLDWLPSSTPFPNHPPLPRAMFA